MKSMEKKTMELIKKSENVVEDLYKATGRPVMDLLRFDAKTGAAIGGCMEVYKESKEYLLDWANVIDRTQEDLKEIKEIVELLRRQNERLEERIQDMDRHVREIGKENKGA